MIASAASISDLLRLLTLSNAILERMPDDEVRVPSGRL